MRRNDVASTSFRRHVPTRFLINHCQIITFLILKSYIIENSRIELKRLVLPVPSNQIKLHLLLFYPSSWYICDFFLFHIEIVGKSGLIIGGWGGQRVCFPPPPPGPLFLRLCITMITTSKFLVGCVCEIITYQNCLLVIRPSMRKMAFD